MRSLCAWKLSERSPGPCKSGVTIWLKPLVVGYAVERQSINTARTAIRFFMARTCQPEARSPSLKNIFSIHPGAHRDASAVQSSIFCRRPDGVDSGVNQQVDLFRQHV